MGGDFQYVRDLRYTTSGDLDFEAVRQVLNDEREPQDLRMDPGTLVLFRGRESIHRVTPAQGQQTRVLAVLAYNSQSGIELSESSRMTFYGRLGNEQ
jgi:predicted 2-oxoglutarate/Fe(II)-dependent dioxygenase YbiX